MKSNAGLLRGMLKLKVIAVSHLEDSKGHLLNYAPATAGGIGTEPNMVWTSFNQNANSTRGAHGGQEEGAGPEKTTRAKLAQPATESNQQPRMKCLKDS